MGRIVLTHPLPRIGPLANRLRALGHTVLEMPLRRLESLIDSHTPGALSDEIRSTDWVVFSSPGTVESAWLALPRPWPRQVGIATVGSGTEQALLASGFDPSQLREPIVRPAHAPYDAGTLMRVAPFVAPQGLRVLVLRGESGRDDWINSLRERGARVQCLAVHRSQPILISPDALQLASRWLNEATRDRVIFVFTTMDAIASLNMQLPAVGRESARALAVHPKLVMALHESGWVQASLLEPGEPGLLAGLE